MTARPVIAVFDIGKTNKKILLFDQDYKVVQEEEIIIPLIEDEDAVACDDLVTLTAWVREVFERVQANTSWAVKALNFSTFGASFVHLDEKGIPLTPLYSYLKPISPKISESFYNQFGEACFFSFQTGSPVLHMLNSGIQLYWLKKERPELFKQIHRSLHLPQYLSHLFTGRFQADITSIGCHTGLWDIHHRRYHDWIKWEQLTNLLPEAEDYTSSTEINYKGNKLLTGIGLHDSSASLLPFTSLSSEPVAILSTGTWNISMLPSFSGKLTEEDYRKDCLYYLLGANQPVAASRIFLGHEFEQQVKKMNSWFGKEEKYYLEVKQDRDILQYLLENNNPERSFIPEAMTGSGPFPQLQGKGVDLSKFDSFEQAYHKLLLDTVWLQKQSLDLLLDQSPVKKIYVTGGFARNDLFMKILAQFYPAISFFTASVNNGTALGAALALHDKWNPSPKPSGIVSLSAVNVDRVFDAEKYVLMGIGS